MRRFLTLVSLFCLAIPAGISISGCTRNPGENYCNGLGFGPKITDPVSILLLPQTSGVSLAFGQTKQMINPSAKTCQGASASTGTYTWGTTNNRLVDISTGGNVCAGTWNRNSGGGIPDFTICSAPSPLPVSKEGLPYGSAYVTASASSVSSNPVIIEVHPAVTSISLVGPSQCLSQGQIAQLDAQACFAGSNSQQQLLCAPSGTTPACPLPPSVSSVPSCSVALGTLSYSIDNAGIGLLNNETDQITAQLPGTTAINASVSNSGSSAGYFSTCPPASITVTLANGAKTGTVAQGVQQNLVTTVTDTNGNLITGLPLTYQSTDPVDINAGSGGGITTNFPGVASIFATCQPPSCNPTPINQTGLYGTGFALTSNPVTVTTPGTASDYVWFGAPGQSQYVVPVELLSGTIGSTVRLPYVPNSMVSSLGGSNLYLGSARGMMTYTTSSNSVSAPNTNVPGVVLAVSPSNTQVLINDQIRQIFYIASTGNSSAPTFSGLGAAAAWTPDSGTLYITDSAQLGGNHTDTLYVYSQNTGWSTYKLPSSAGSLGAQSLAITVPSVGAYLGGSPTVAHTWCPSGTVGNFVNMLYYPQGDSVNAQTDVLAATTDGNHILGAAFIGGGITLSDIGVTIPTTPCSSTTTGSVETLNALNIAHNLNQAQLSGINATAVNQIIASPASNLAFITYTAPSTNTNAVLPYYKPVAGNTGTLGAVGYLTMTGSSAISAPIAGAFTPDDTLFFVSTAGDNLIHYINVQTLKDTQQIAPNLPACTPLSSGGNDPGCTYTGTGTIVPTTAIAVEPRSTT